jgi:hypothetical protein
LEKLAMPSKFQKAVSWFQAQYKLMSIAVVRTIPVRLKHAELTPVLITLAQPRAVRPILVKMTLARLKVARPKRVAMTRASTIPVKPIVARMTLVKQNLVRPKNAKLKRVSQINVTLTRAR